jgi:hypothetical protein
VSSRYGGLREVFPVRPGGFLVVDGTGLQASVQDADEPVGQAAERVIMFDPADAEAVVEGAGAGRGVQGREGLRVQRVNQPVVVDEPAATTFFFPDARVIGLVAA